MIRIAPFQPSDLATVERFVAELQEFEREIVPELRPGIEIAADYVAALCATVSERDGVMLLARVELEPVGYVAAWPEDDDDPLLEASAQAHGYVSDIYVTASWRRHGVGRRLLAAAELEMRRRGCRQLRIVSKAGNHAALAAYEATGYRPYEVLLWKPLTED